MLDEQGLLRVGGRVRIVGLTSAGGFALSGKCGTLVDCAVFNGRFCVRIDSGGDNALRAAGPACWAATAAVVLPIHRQRGTIKAHAPGCDWHRILHDCEVQRFASAR